MILESFRKYSQQAKVLFQSWPAVDINVGCSVSTAAVEWYLMHWNAFEYQKKTLKHLNILSLGKVVLMLSACSGAGNSAQAPQWNHRPMAPSRACWILKHCKFEAIYVDIERISKYSIRGVQGYIISFIHNTLRERFSPILAVNVYIYIYIYTHTNHFEM